MSNGTPYNHESPIDRRELADAILAVLRGADFMEEFVEDKGTKERVFYRPVDGTDGMRVAVYTSIVGDSVRKVGKDAVRVCGLYRSQRTDRERGIVSETRIHRTGTIEAICDRLLDRMRNVYGSVRRAHRCPRCGAPTFKAKSGKDVCADLCWKSDEDLAMDTATYRSRRGRRNYRRHY